MKEHAKHPNPGHGDHAVYGFRNWPDQSRDYAEPEASGAEEKSKGKAKRAALTGQAKLLLLVNGLFVAANALSGTFVNVYLWKAKQDLTMIGWFSVYTQVTMSLIFWLGGKWVKEGNKMNALRLGLVVAASFYLLVLVLGKSAVSYIPVLGIVQGIMAGLFWLSFNVVYFEVTGPDNRDRFNGWAGLIGSAAGMLAPWLSGLIITRMAGAKGYTIIFAMSLAVFLAGFVCSFFLKKRKTEERYHWRFGLNVLKREEGRWRRILLAMFAQGMREGVFAFIIPLLVYISTKNEMKLGSYALITSAVSLVSYLLVGRLLKRRFRKWAILVGVTALSLLILPFFWRVNYATLLFYGIGTALFMPLYGVPVTSVVFDLIGRERDGAENRVEYIGIREIALNAGRMIGTLSFIALVSFTSSPFALNLLLFGMSWTTFLVWIFLLPWLRVSRRREAKPAAGR